MGLALSNETANTRGCDHDLKGGNQARSVRLGQEILRNDRLECDRQLRPHLLLPISLEHIHYAVDCLRRAQGVERAEHKRARLSSRDGQLNCLQVAHFADEDHVGVLPHHVTQRIGEGMRWKQAAGSCCSRYMLTRKHPVSGTT